MWNARVLFLIVNLLFVKSMMYDSRCKLARDLMKNGVPNDVFFGSWVCLIEQVSNRDTRKLVEKNGKKFYGLYQIPGSWCKVGKPGGDCNIACESLLDDDIRVDTACATKIFRLKGFQYWPKWEIRCKNNLNHYITEIYKCPDLFTRRSSPERITSDDIEMFGRSMRRHRIKNMNRSLARTGYDLFLTAR